MITLIDKVSCLNNQDNNCVVATTDIDEGDVLIILTSEAHVPEESITSSRCCFCLEITDQDGCFIHTCNCGAVFCSQECLKEGSGLHTLSGECLLLTMSSDLSLDFQFRNIGGTRDLRLALRLLYLIHTDMLSTPISKFCSNKSLIMVPE